MHIKHNGIERLLAQEQWVNSLKALQRTENTTADHIQGHFENITVQI